LIFRTERAQSALNFEKLPFYDASFMMEDHEKFTPDETDENGNGEFQPVALRDDHDYCEVIGNKWR